MLRIRFIFFSIYVILAFIIGATITVFLSLFVKNKTSLFHKASQIWFKYFILPLSGIEVKFSGLSNIPKDKPVLYVSNHQSLVDIPILLAGLPGNFRFIAKKELFSIPFLGWYIGASGHIKIDREASISAHKTLKHAVSVIESGESIVIFPEGTRGKEGKLGPFKRGSLLLAEEGGVPILPIAISQSYKIIPKGRLIINPGKVSVRIGKPIEFKKQLTHEEMLKKIRNEIESML